MHISVEWGISLFDLLLYTLISLLEIRARALNFSEHSVLSTIVYFFLWHLIFDFQVPANSNVNFQVEMLIPYILKFRHCLLSLFMRLTKKLFDVFFSLLCLTHFMFDNF